MVALEMTRGNKSQAATIASVPPSALKKAIPQLEQAEKAYMESIANTLKKAEIIPKDEALAIASKLLADAEIEEQPEIDIPPVKAAVKAIPSHMRE